MNEQLQRQTIGALIKRFWSGEEGQDLVEYALLCTVVSLAGVLGVQALISAVANVFTIISNQLR
jgi:Flp pilus assembly pilin Flp